jgi:hypothetical protein
MFAPDGDLESVGRYGFNNLDTLSALCRHQYLNSGHLGLGAAIIRLS